MMASMDTAPPPVGDAEMAMKDVPLSDNNATENIEQSAASRRVVNHSVKWAAVGFLLLGVSIMMILLGLILRAVKDRYHNVKGGNGSSYANMMMGQP
jgi:hypothetical protein